MDEAILGLDAEDAREARARSWQVQNGSVYFRHQWGLIWFRPGRLNGLVWFTFEAW